MIEKKFDVSFIANLALHEKQIQQNYRPVIAVHKWFARRPGTLFRGLLLSEFAEGNLKDIFFKAHNIDGKIIADPFMGGGTPLLEANRIGCDIIGYDINPMAYWIVKQELAHLNLEQYKEVARYIYLELKRNIGHLYQTICEKCKNKAHVKYFLWVKTYRCPKCGKAYDLFPGYLIADNIRHPYCVIICASCGELNEVSDKKKPGYCFNCNRLLTVKGNALRNRSLCPNCGNNNIFPDKTQGKPKHRMIAIEYHCSKCKNQHRGRFFKKPDLNDLNNYAIASSMLDQTDLRFVPQEKILPGDETDRLFRWGYTYYKEMFNKRQLLGLELLCQLIENVSIIPIRNALATNISDLTRYQNMLCRYDTKALKSLDIFSVHGFPVGLIQCESNILGLVNDDNGSVIGSGGWVNIVDKYIRAKQYCERPFETKIIGNKKVQVRINGEWIGEFKKSADKKKNVKLVCGSSTLANLPTSSLDAVFTDPPYFANVQYAELMDFCYVWLRKLAVDQTDVFSKETTRNEYELTGNSTMERCFKHFTEGLTNVFTHMAKALKPGSPFVFTYHHNKIEAYYPIAVALLDSSLVCSATLPCPAEMGSSIHINGTGSSIIDTVFVCRSTGVVSAQTLVNTPAGVALLVQEDMERLKSGGIKLALGDIRCITYGHLIRLAVWNLRKEWDSDSSIDDKLERVNCFIQNIGGWSSVQRYFSDEVLSLNKVQIWETQMGYGGPLDEISF